MIIIIRRIVIIIQNRVSIYLATFTTSLLLTDRKTEI